MSAPHGEGASHGSEAGGGKGFEYVEAASGIGLFSRMAREIYNSQGLRTFLETMSETVGFFTAFLIPGAGGGGGHKGGGAHH